MIINTQAPTRIDLAAGTLDIWPVAHILNNRFPHLFNNLPPLTVNSAISLKTQCRLEFSNTKSHNSNTDKSSSTHKTLLFSTDGGQRWEGHHWQEAENLPLHRAVVGFYWHQLEKHMGSKYNVLHVHTASQVPPGSGLGGSSSLMVSLIWAFKKALGINISDNNERWTTAQLALNLEAGILGGLAGNQDHLAATWGGLQSILHTSQGPQRKTHVHGQALFQHLVFVHTAESHKSIVPNQNILDGFLAGNKEIEDKLCQIAKAGHELHWELKKPQFSLEDIARAIDKEWQARRNLIPGLMTPLLEKLYHLGMAQGALAGRLCGAGCGGVLIFIVKTAQSKETLENILIHAGGHILKPHFCPQGVE